jgi:hypothetical protein
VNDVADAGDAWSSATSINVASTQRRMDPPVDSIVGPGRRWRIARVEPRERRVFSATGSAMVGA